jgi:hypothetical protein
MKYLMPVLEIFSVTDTELTQLILTFVPNQVPFGLKICQLQNKIISWLTCLLWNPPQKKRRNQQPIPNKLSLGKDSSNISNQLPSTMIHSLTNSLDTDPRLDKDGKSSLFLHRQPRGYKLLDKPEKQQVALTGSIIKEINTT